MRAFFTITLTLLLCLQQTFLSNADSFQANSQLTNTSQAQECNTVCGWQLIDNIWYYYDNNGDKLTGWQFIAGKWYYLDDNGACAINTVTPDGYTVNENGAWIPDIENLLGLALPIEDIEEITLYESSTPVNTTKKVFSSQDDIRIIMEALNSLQLSTEKALGFAPGGLLYICIRNADGHLDTICYGSNAICIGKPNETTIYTVTNGHNFYEKLSTLVSTKETIDIRNINLFE